MSIKITLADGSVRDFDRGICFTDIAKSLGQNIARSAIAVRTGDGQLLDMQRCAETDMTISLMTGESPEGLEIIRHSTAHVLAMAVQRLWEGVRVTIGPVITDGFYYDFEFPQDVRIGDGDLARIEKEMARIIRQNVGVVRQVMSREAALHHFEALGESYKVEIIRDLSEGDDITLYSMGEWSDLCRGPHVPALKHLGAFRLTKVAGAYWRGDERNAMLTRIYGTAWANKEDLAAYLHRVEEAKKRDHRLLGRQLDLFSFHPEAPAHAFFHEKGTVLYSKLQSFVRKANEAYGFGEIQTPLMMNVELWHRSGHFEHYAENMYFVDLDETQAAVKPMNCPGHCLIYGSRKRSYRDLPLKMAEFGRVHRHEKSGVVNGLFRVRSFVQDDAHIFCRPEQISDMVSLCLEQIDYVYRGLGFAEYHIELSTRPEKSLGSDEIWEHAESALKGALEKRQTAYTLNPGDGAFYGPKIDFHLIDAIGRRWQCGTVQLDFSMPERFGLEYVTEENRTEQPVMIHRAVLGSLERFLAIFTEHHGGHFPLWAAPVQVQVLNVTQIQEDYASLVAGELRNAGFRVELDIRNEKLGYKIREAQLKKIPYMIVIGDREVSDQTVSPRQSNGTQSEALSVAAFISQLQQECGDLHHL
ncbi:MAG: threonine--tRNA ligase [Deltaproteobacteria bacterium]|nr:threonine--tRNA ligase [Deltaproteobacteria bacterium]